MDRIQGKKNYKTIITQGNYNYSLIVEKFW